MPEAKKVTTLQEVRNALKDLPQDKFRIEDCEDGWGWLAYVRVNRTAGSYYARRLWRSKCGKALRAAGINCGNVGDHDILVRTKV